MVATTNNESMQWMMMAAMKRVRVERAMVKAMILSFWKIFRSAS
jgi:hypothetical protein